MFSSAQKLRFDQCRSILESLGDIENTVNERLKIQPKSKDLVVPLSPIMPKQSLPCVINPKSYLNTLKIGKDAGTRKPPNLSLKNIMPGIFGSGTLKPGRTNSEPDQIKRAIAVPVVSEGVLYK